MRSVTPAVVVSPRSLIAALTLALTSHALRAQEPGSDIEKTIESPSPDGRYAFLALHPPDQRTLDLIEKASGKVLQRIAESDEDSDELTTEVLWAPNSRRFAITETYHNRRMNDLGVYIRTGDTFREVKIPELEATLPEKLAGDKDHLWHMNVIDWKTPLRWSKDGTLTVKIETTIDGNDSFATATRTVVLGIDKAGAAKILKSTQKVTSHIEPTN